MSAFGLGNIKLGSDLKVCADGIDVGFIGGVGDLNPAGISYGVRHGIPEIVGGAAGAALGYRGYGGIGIIVVGIISNVIRALAAVRIIIDLDIGYRSGEAPGDVISGALGGPGYPVNRGA